MAKYSDGWPDEDIPPSKPLTADELKEHRRSVLTLFGGAIVAHVVFAYIVGAPPLRNAVANAWSGVIASMQALW